jgi:hypothetical protein
LPQPIECEKTDDFDPTYKVSENLAILNFEESKNLRKDFWQTLLPSLINGM